jgi:Tfp pilus assembly PilM family ATPase
MSHTTLCVDVSGSSLKAVLVEKGFRQTRVIDQIQAPFPPEASIADMAREIQDLILASKLDFDVLVLGLNAKKALLQKMTFPFTDTGKIGDVLPFELENVLPARVTDYSLDFLHTEGGKAREAVIMAALYPKDLLQEWVRCLNDIGLNPQRVDLDIGALFSLGRELSKQTARSILFIDLGWDRTNLVWMHGPALHALRTLSLGLKHMALEITESGEDGTDLDTAKERLLSGASGIAELFSFTELIQQVRLTLLASEAPEPPEEIALLGEGASDSTAGVISQSMGTPASLLETLPDQPPDPRLQAHELAIPFSMARFESLRRNAMNLLRGDLASTQATGLWRPHLRFGIVAAVAIILTWMFSFGTGVILERQRLQELESALTSNFEEIVGQTDPDIRPVQYPSVIRSRIRALSTETFSGDVPPLKGVELLWLISTALPPNLEIQNDLFALDGNIVRMNGVARDFKTVDSIKNNLDQLPAFSEVKIMGANVNQGGDGVSFSLRLIVAGEQGV